MEVAEGYRVKMYKTADCTGSFYRTAPPGRACSIRGKSVLHQGEERAPSGGRACSIRRKSVLHLWEERAPSDGEARRI
ncbi:MAG: hypothetical protein IJ253_10895 [Bacteroidaceae bacterium]|nr:hypothetical protein [Bacteroidaceae bacterium]